MDIKTKVCNRCKEEKPLSTEYFGMLKASNDGFNPTCKKCRKLAMQKYQKTEKGKRTQAKAGKKYYNNHEEKVKAKARQHYRDNIEAERKRCREYSKTARGREVDRAIQANRSAMKKALPYPRNSNEWHQVLDEFGGVCAITGKSEYSLEHFIPLSWGHGGSLANNIYPMEGSLNMSKSNKHPFKWAERNLKGEQYEAFLNVARYLAELNGMTLKEFRKFVTWCYKNQRTVEQVKADNERGLTSQDLWRASLSNQ